jgi:tripartite-type tricarboxylate transporter receptor subunit TctC
VLKDVPTMIEAGYPEFVVGDWQGIAVRTGTPREVIMRINAAIAAALATREVNQMFVKLGAEPAAGSPEAFAKLIAAEVERWGKLARAADIKVQ